MQVYVISVTLFAFILECGWWLLHRMFTEAVG